MQSAPGLRAQDAADGFIYALTRDASLRYGIAQRRVRAFDIRPVEDNVYARLDGEHRRLAGFVVLHDGAHIERVGKDEAVKAEIFTQYPVNNCRRERRGPGLD